MKKLLFCLLGWMAVSIAACSQGKLAPDADNAGLKLPQGFGALKVAEGMGQPRHIAVTKEGDIYIKLQRLKNGSGIYWLHDSNGDGKADETKGFGNYTGTGI